MSGWTTGEPAKTAPAPVAFRLLLLGTAMRMFVAITLAFAAGIFLTWLAGRLRRSTPEPGALDPTVDALLTPRPSLFVAHRDRVGAR